MHIDGRHSNLVLGVKVSIQVGTIEKKMANLEKHEQIKFFCAKHEQKY